MPEYTYRCEQCGNQFDIHQGFTDDPLAVCPVCKKEGLHKVYRPARVVFKGKGFYVTDNRTGSRSSYLNNGSETSHETSKINSTETSKTDKKEKEPKKAKAEKSKVDS
ncbi:MAG: hypothetical protein JXA19_03300 [Anaerolineales bacterium]|nr:hypothetical protein [Anaerolineales bacterium]